MLVFGRYEQVRVQILHRLIHQVCSDQRSSVTEVNIQWRHVQVQVEYSAVGENAFSLSPSVGTLLYRQSGATSASVLHGDSPSP